jgi:hypothetical protein
MHLFYYFYTSLLSRALTLLASSVEFFRSP